VTVPLAIALGLIIAVLYSFHLRFLNPFLLVYVDALRAFPVLVLLVLIFYGLPFLGIEFAAFPAAVLAIALNNSGYYGEIFRAGIETVPRGQREAARSTGLTAWQAVFSVVLPQAVRNVLAPLAGNTLELIKTTSIATTVALPELLRSARVAQESTYNPTPLTAAALIYFLLLWPLTRVVARLERNMVASH
jgi:polar amino acid transport system permease protein